jgi:hypothetical protein
MTAYKRNNIQNFDHKLNKCKQYFNELLVSLLARGLFAARKLYILTTKIWSAS